MASRGRKILYGCGIGCLAVIVLAVSSCTVFYLWLNRPGELLQPERLVGTDTTGYVAWTLRLEDPGTGEFVRTLLAGLQRVSERNRVRIHPLVDSWLTGLQRRRNQKQLDELFPLVAAWTVHPGADPEDDLQLFSISLKRAGNRLVLTDWLLGMALGLSDEVGRDEYRGERIYTMPARRGVGVSFFIRGNDLFFASDTDTARRAVDRLVADSPPAGTAGGLEELLRRVPADAPMRGAIGNERGELSRVWGRLTGAPGPGGRGDAAWDGFRGVTLAGALTDQDSVELELRFRCADAASAASRSEAVAEALRAALEPTGFPVEVHCVPEGEWIRGELKLREVATRIEEFLGAKAAGR